MKTPSSIQTNYLILCTNNFLNKQRIPNRIEYNMNYVAHTDSKLHSITAVHIICCPGSRTQIRIQCEGSTYLVLLNFDSLFYLKNMFSILLHERGRHMRSPQHFPLRVLVRKLQSPTNFMSGYFVWVPYEPRISVITSKLIDLIREFGARRTNECWSLLQQLCNRLYPCRHRRTKNSVCMSHDFHYLLSDAKNLLQHNIPLKPDNASL